MYGSESFGIVGRRQGVAPAPVIVVIKVGSNSVSHSEPRPIRCVSKFSKANLLTVLQKKTAVCCAPFPLYTSEADAREKKTTRTLRQNKKFVVEMVERWVVVLSGAKFGKPSNPIPQSSSSLSVRR